MHQLALHTVLSDLSLIVDDQHLGKGNSLPHRRRVRIHQRGIEIPRLGLGPNPLDHLLDPRVDPRGQPGAPDQRAQIQQMTGFGDHGGLGIGQVAAQALQHFRVVVPGRASGAEQHDAQAAVRWLRKNASAYGIDSSRIGMTGGSAGAATSLFAAFDGTDVGDSGNPGYSSAVNAVVANSGAMGTGLQGPGDAPSLMLNGTADTTVKYPNAKATCDKATAVHLWCTFVTFPGVGHTVGAYEPDLVKSLTATYFYDHLATAPGTSAAPFPDAVSFVQRQYRDLLLRDADPAGLDYWSRQVAHGTVTPAALVDQFAQSSEMQRSVGTVTRSYLAYLGRVPDPSGLTYWVGKIRSGMPVARVNASLAASSEFQRRQAGLTDSQFIDSLYRDLLNRAPDAGGKAHWMAKLASGTSRADVVGSFVAQPESIRATAPYVAVTIGTSGLLGRAPTTAEVNQWVPALRSGTPATTWYQSVLDSNAYRTRITP